MFIAVGTSALIVLTVVSITGGFVIDVGLLHVSAHRVIPPLVVAVVAYAAAAARGRDSFLAVASAVPTFLERHAASIAVLLATAAAGVGIGYGTYAASGADASGYLNQAELLTHGELVVPAPLASRVSWPEPEWSFAPLGFRPGPRAGEIVPTYPPGLPMVMALASVVAGDSAPFLVVPLLGALTVLCTYWLGARLAGPAHLVRPTHLVGPVLPPSPLGSTRPAEAHETSVSGSDRPPHPPTRGRTEGAVAAALMASSPVFLFQIVQPMSDVPAAALWTLALLVAASRRPFAAGAASGLAVLTRPSLSPLAVAVVAVLTICSDEASDSRRARARRLLSFGAVLSLGVGLLALIQSRLYGRPLGSGHGAFAELFDAGNILPNIHDYSVRVFTGEAPALVLAAGAVFVIAVATRNATPLASAMKPLRLTILVALLVLLCYLPYGVFPDWSYLRFLLPVFPTAFITAGALLVNASLRLPAALRGVVLLISLAAACSTNVLIASREGAFDLRRYESRYRTAGRYLDSALPKDAVIVTSQESGSAHYYTGRPILRWDLLNAGLDSAVDALTVLGWHPVLLVEDWEEPALRRRFPSSALARLDWRARALIGTTTRVRLLDPSDRGHPAGWPADRLP